MRIVYFLIVLFLTLNFLWYLFQESDIRLQISTCLVLIVLILRLFLIK